MRVCHIRNLMLIVKHFASPKQALASAVSNYTPFLGLLMETRSNMPSPCFTLPPAHLTSLHCPHVTSPYVTLPSAHLTSLPPHHLTLRHLALCPPHVTSSLVFIPTHLSFSPLLLPTSHPTSSHFVSHPTSLHLSSQ